MKILITGGASGLGAAITKCLAKDSNNTVYFTYKNSVVQAQQLEADYKNTAGISCDFGNAQSLENFIKELPKFEIDAVVHNAYHGAFLKTYFHKIPIADFQEDFKENIIPIVEITQVLLNQFRKKKSGKIITILTAALSNTPPIGSAVYSANKAYLEKLTKSWAIENAKFNITSNSVSPSFMLTSLTSVVDERMVEQMIENHPLKKLLTVEEVAETVLFLTHASNHINGVDILLNAASSIN